MRQLILLRGVMGSGKSTWVKDNNLEDFTLSPDALRVKSGAFSKRDIYGNFGANVHKDDYVWKLIMNLLEQRMASGMLTVIDATHGTERAINAYRELSNKYRYRVYVIDFKAPLDVLKQRVKGRNKREEGLTDGKYIPEWAVESKFKQLESHHIPSWVTKLTPENAIENISWRYEDDTDKNIYVFGDIHSSYTVLKHEWDKLQLESNDTDKIIFVGDYFDRGMRPVETFKFLVDKMKKPNVTLLMGNHDYNLFNIVKNTIVKAPKHTRLDTYYPLLKAGVSEKEIKNFVNNLQQGVFINKRGKKYWVTHGGILPVDESDPLALNKISTNEMIYGSGDFSDPIDASFSKDSNIVSVHGHRNMKHIKPITGKSETLYGNVTGNNSYNLEQGVDDGEFLATLKITNDIDSLILTKNIEFNFSVQDEKWRKDRLLTNLLNNPAAYAKKAMQNKYIRSSKFGDIVALNFTSEAFLKGIWDTFTIKSRGLFIDMNKNEVFARGYDKFFRVDEVGGWSKTNFTGRVSAYKKYNGLLGLLTSDGKKLIYMSKGTIYDPKNESKYAKLVKDTISSQLRGNEDAIKFLVKFLSDKTMLFEVVDESKDPHIVHNFDKPTAVMLDVVYNTLTFKKLGYDSLVLIACKVNMPVKERLGSFTEDIRKHVELISQNKELEGVVLEDRTGYMVKAKTYLYTAVKARRNSWDYAVRNIDTTRDRVGNLSKRLDKANKNDYNDTVGKNRKTKDNIEKLDLILLEEIQKDKPEQNLLNIRKQNNLLLGDK